MGEKVVVVVGVDLLHQEEVDLLKTVILFSASHISRDGAARFSA